jgi:hypothetical protein
MGRGPTRTLGVDAVGIAARVAARPRLASPILQRHCRSRRQQRCSMHSHTQRPCVLS